MFGPHRRVRIAPVAFGVPAFTNDTPTPLPQITSLKLSNVSKGTHMYRAGFTNSMGSTMSSSLSVKVK